MYWLNCDIVLFISYDRTIVTEVTGFHYLEQVQHSDFSNGGTESSRRGTVNTRGYEKACGEVSARKRLRNDPRPWLHTSVRTAIDDNLLRGSILVLREVLARESQQTTGHLWGNGAHDAAMKSSKQLTYMSNQPWVTSRKASLVDREPFVP